MCPRLVHIFFTGVSVGHGVPYHRAEHTDIISLHVLFNVEDLDADELGGNASWTVASDSRYVAGYKAQLWAQAYVVHAARTLNTSSFW